MNYIQPHLYFYKPPCPLLPPPLGTATDRSLIWVNMALKGEVGIQVSIMDENTGQYHGSKDGIHARNGLEVKI